NAVKANGNLKARIRMCLLYYYANVNNALVIGSSDKSEILIGYFTKYGDGGVDLLPIGDLYKTQVRQLAIGLGVPKKIAYKPSSPRLWPGHMAEDELGLSYEEIDIILYAYHDLGLSEDEIVQRCNVSADKVKRVISMVRNSEHKRKMPPIIRIK
ncbi:MAG: NAD(+) synthase, partial [Thermoprotei archaeon]|nr:NAD(+) synthase [Thermoprotei archaeon]